jgi:hypothetical protein
MFQKGNFICAWLEIARTALLSRNKPRISAFCEGQRPSARTCAGAIASVMMATRRDFL